MDIGYMTRRVVSRFQEINPIKTAIKLEDKEGWTFAELDQISNAYGNKLKQLGVKKGDRIGILFYNCLEYFGLYFAASKIGAIAVRLNFRLTSAELQYAINDAGVNLLCFHSELSDRIEPIRYAIGVEDYISLEYMGYKVPSWAFDWSLLEGGSTEPISEKVYLDDPVMLMYTSGTTGQPKGAIWTHNNTFWFSSMQVMKWGITGSEIAMTTGPLYHVGAMEDLALPVLMMGGTIIITESKGFNINRVIDVVIRESVTDCFLFPFMIYDMLNIPEVTALELSQLNRIFTGGDPVIPYAIEKLNEHFPHIGLIQVYGLTEGTPIAASLDPKDVLTKNHTVGKPMPLTEIKVIKDNGEEANIGEVGEILIKSPSVSTGYWGKPQETASTFVDGWCKTGDLGQYDEDGFLVISGRKKDMIRSGGENIYAVEVEDVLYRYPGISDATIIAIPDPKYIEAVCAVIVPKKGMILSKQDIIEHCSKYLAGYKRPKEVIVVQELPRTPSGKVKKFVLRERYSDLRTEKM